MVVAFKENIEYPAERGFKLVFNVIDSVTSKRIRAYPKETKVGIQLVDPHDHRTNTAERAIQTFRNQFTSRLCIGDQKFPSILWWILVDQAVRSLHVMRTSRVHPKESAYHVLEGVNDSNREPWPPPSTRAAILNPPNVRASWDQHLLYAYYIGPAWDHYRQMVFFVPSTWCTRVPANSQLYLEHCEVPRETVMDEAVRVANDLVNTIKKL